jgi:DnaJ-class molecular chaperone
MREEWYDPQQADVVEFFTSTVQEAARRRGITPCNTCHGIGVIVMVNHVTKVPFKVPCSGCGL